MDMPVLIPAAGASSRMRGADKLLMEVAGTPLLRRQIDLAKGLGGDVRVALPARPHPRHDVVPGDVQVIEVPDAATGMSASVRALVRCLGDHVPHAMILLADLPALTTGDLRRVADAVTQHPDALIWRGGTEQGAPGHPMIIAAALFGPFLTLRGDTGGSDIAKAHKAQTVLVPLPGERARLDLDTPEDWAAWRAKTT